MHLQSVILNENEPLSLPSVTEVLSRITMRTWGGGSAGALSTYGRPAAGDCQIDASHASLCVMVNLTLRECSLDAGNVLDSEHNCRFKLTWLNGSMNAAAEHLVEQSVGRGSRWLACLHDCISAGERIE